MKNAMIGMEYGSSIAPELSTVKDDGALEAYTGDVMTDKTVANMDSETFTTMMKQRAMSAYMDSPAPDPVANKGGVSNATKDIVLVKQNGEYFLTIDPMCVTDIDHTSPTRLKVWFHQSVNPDDCIHISLAPPFLFYKVPPSFFSTILNQIYVSAGKTVGHIDRCLGGAEAYFMFACNEVVVGEYGSLLLTPYSQKLPEDRCQMERAENAFTLNLLSNAVQKGWITQEEYALIDSGGMVFLTANDFRKRATETNGLIVSD